MDENGDILELNSGKKTWFRVEKAEAFPPPYINPLVRLFIYSCMVLLTGNFFMGWTGLQELFYKAGSFEDLCDISTSEILTIRGNDIIDCPARKAAINQLYTIAFSTNIICCIFSGLILSLFGHRNSFILAHLTNFTCWIFIGIFPKNGNLLRVLMFIIGLTAESMFLPITTVSLYFPDNRSFILTFLGSLRSLSFFAPSVVSFIYLSPKMKSEDFIYVAIGFGTLAYLGSAVIGFFTVQKNFFDKSIDKSSNFQCSKKEDDVTSLSDRCLKWKEVVKDGIRSRHVILMLLFTIAASLHMGSVEFINMSQRELLITSEGDSAIHIFRYAQALTFIPGMIFGTIIDRFGTAIIMIVMHTFMIGAYVMFCMDNFRSKIMGCMFYMAGGCLYLSNIYSFIYENFPPERLGFVLGFVLIFCGTMVLLNIPLYNKGLEYTQRNNFRKISFVLMGYAGVSFMSMVWVVYLKKKGKLENTEKVDENKK